VVTSSSNQFYIYRTNSVNSADRWTDTNIEKIGVTFTGNPASQNSSSSSATLAATGREQVYIAIAAAAIISITIMIVAFGVSRIKPKE
jgi:hypothetical protein